MEIFDVYDKNRNKTGETMIRGEEPRQGWLHMVIHISIINSEGKMLIQKRQPSKHGWGGLWDVSVGGSAVSGEIACEAAERELAEELGIKHDFSALRPAFTVNFPHGFDDNFIIKKDVDLSALTLQKEEVEAVKWADYDEICDMIDGGTFIPYHKSYIKFIFDMADSKDAHRN